jgi:hypothetical protein
MQVRCIRARADADVGDLREVPDGSQVSDLYWEPVEASPPPVPGTIPVPASTPPESLPASSAPASSEGTPA